MKNKTFKHISRWFETFVVEVLLGLFSVLPLDVASAAGGKLLVFIGPFTKRHLIALKNLRFIFPEKSEAEQQQIARGMWEHLGRNFAELAFLRGSVLTSRIHSVKGLEHTKMPQVIYVSGHFGQWELLNSVVYDRGIPITSVYRHLNNTILDERLKAIRLSHTTHLIRKKGDSAIAMVRALTQGANLSLLIDQRLTSGAVLPFLGHDARTNTAAAKLALKMNLPIIPAFVTRTKGAHFIAEILPPISIIASGDEQRDVQHITQKFNALLEARIRAHPEQYLWLHDRWK